MDASEDQRPGEGLPVERSEDGAPSPPYLDPHPEAVHQGEVHQLQEDRQLPEPDG